MRQVAWLNAVPKTDKKRRTRRQSFEDMGRDPPVPDCDGMFIAGYMFEIGIGEHGIGHAEIAAWQGNTGISLQPWECRFIHAMAGEYLHEYHRAAEDAKAPWDGAAIDTRALITAQMKETIKGM